MKNDVSKLVYWWVPMCYYRNIISFQPHPITHCRSFQPEGPSILNMKTGQCMLPGGAIIPQTAVGVKMDIASIKDIQVFNSNNLGRRKWCKYIKYTVGYHSIYFSNVNIPEYSTIFKKFVPIIKHSSLFLSRVLNLSLRSLLVSTCNA